jgi:CDP-diacylglycerol---glycerol-3-phosphate 3-phosphatidyltransferase
MLTTLPMTLTLSRIIAIPVVVALFYVQGDYIRYIACAIYTTAAVTDYFDGYFARAWQQQTKLGRIFDPIADKLLVAATILMLVAVGRIGSWDVLPALVILCREVLVSGLREYLAELKVGVPVSRIAKWKTTVQLLALGFLVAGPAGETVLPGTEPIGLTLLWLAAALTLWTGWDYMRAGIKHVIDDPR